MNIPFNKPYESGNELCYIKDAISRGHISGDGFYTKSCNKFIEEQTGALKALIVHSGTAALEMAAILINTTLGDEIIMPSFTFVSTANAFVLRGAKPVFVDIRPDTQNIDETKIEAAITPRTKAI
ncbi:MAG: aminotransferase class I/II-fold pyridoxal phosphate-dependent enzyme, partial [Akkermansia sp.]